MRPIVSPIATWPTAAAMFRKVAIELLSTTVLGIGKTVDRLMADADRMTFQRHTACNLFRRPTSLQAILDRGFEIWIHNHFAMNSAAFLIHVLSGDSIVAVQLGQLVV